MSEITIVTALFDIGRGGWHESTRGVDKYIEYFRFWARIKNRLIIYTEPDKVEIITQIRKGFGLEEKTKVIAIENFKEIIPGIYEEMEKVISSSLIQNFRKNPQSPESCNAKYTFITFLKPWFVANSVKNKLASGMVAWLDFGYNHGGATYTQEEEFDFLWEYDFPQKINLFALKPLNELPVFEIIRKMPVDMTAGVIVAPDKYWLILAEAFIRANTHLSRCGFVDDDQTLLIMAYRENPDIFAVHLIQDWFLVFKNFGGEHLTIEQKEKYKIEKHNAFMAVREKKYIAACKYFFLYSVKKIQYRIEKNH